MNAQKLADRADYLASLSTERDVKDMARMFCKRRGTGQCAAICLSHFSTSTTNGGCPEAPFVFADDAKMVAALLAAAVAKGREDAALICDAHTARRKQTLIEIYGTDDVSEMGPIQEVNPIFNKAVAYGELYAYDALAHAIRYPQPTDEEQACLRSFPTLVAASFWRGVNLGNLLNLKASK